VKVLPPDLSLALRKERTRTTAHRLLLHTRPAEQAVEILLKTFIVIRVFRLPIIVIPVDGPIHRQRRLE
jgi:hypothetical protein